MMFVIRHGFGLMMMTVLRRACQVRQVNSVSGVVIVMLVKYMYPNGNRTHGWCHPERQDEKCKPASSQSEHHRRIVVDSMRSRQMVKIACSIRISPHPNRVFKLCSRLSAASGVISSRFKSRNVWAMISSGGVNKGN